ncbi:hypothetical protein GZH53_13655 [Flavihumibacter sp. R14]|nr:hypothetical protein [Flavihumibacter soli]
MKRIYTLNIAACLLLVMLFACTKEPRLPEGVNLPTLTINRISELPFSNTEWKHVFGGMAEVKYIKGTSAITDSLDLAKLAAYQKTLELGTYDIQLRSRSTATADTFIRFSAELKGLVVDQGQAISLDASTNDGLITIKKESVKDNSVPTFTPVQAGAKTYKFGLIDGYYFIYVTAGTNGKVAFDSKSTDDRISKDLTIVASNHYNLVVVTNGRSSFGVELQKFAYNEVQVSSPTLITIEIPLYSLIQAYETTFLIADETGKILNTTRYVQGTTVMKLTSREPYSKDRLSVFVLNRPLDNTFQPYIYAYMNVKRGSTWLMGHQSLPEKNYGSPFAVSLKNVPAFSVMTFGTDASGFTIRSAQDLPFFSEQRYSISDESKIFFQVEDQGKAFYNFFDFSKGTQSFVIDPALCTTPSLSKTITLPGQGGITVWGRRDKKYRERYYFGQKYIPDNSGVFFYPNETYEEYYTLLTYSLNGSSYYDSFKGPAIPGTTSPMKLSFEASGHSLATFQPTFTGKFDYYQAHFETGALSMDVFVPSAAAASSLAYPDFTAFAGFTGFNASTVALKYVEASQYEGFTENKLGYKNWHSYELNGKAMGRRY